MRLATIVIAAAAFSIGATAADAKCTRLAFSVNDYGKDGPIKDAKALLDKYIAQWTSERGIKKYTTGKKDVSCELFLDVIVFDEHTCKAAATVCWGDGQQIQSKTGDTAAVAAAPAAVAKPKAPVAVAPVATGALPKAVPAAVKAPAPVTPAAGAPAAPALAPPKAQ